MFGNKDLSPFFVCAAIYIVLMAKCTYVCSEILLLKHAEVYHEKDGAQGRCHSGEKICKEQRNKRGILMKKDERRKRKGKLKLKY